MGVSCTVVYFPGLQGKWLQRYSVSVTDCTVGSQEDFIKSQLIPALN